MTSIYKTAQRAKLRLSTPKGLLSVEQAWDLSVSQLEKSVRSAYEALPKTDSSTDLDFLGASRVVEPETQLAFEVLKDMYLTKKAEAEAASTARETKEHNEKIMKLIHDKQEEGLKNMSIADLQNMLK